MRAWVPSPGFFLPRVTCRTPVIAVHQYHSGTDSATELRSCQSPEDPVSSVAEEQRFKPLLRSILRQARRLPDPASRLYIRQYVLTRYRRYYDDLGEDRRLASRLHSTRRGLNLLHRANEGYLPANLKVLMATYGRSGRRRQELLEAVADADSEVTSRRDPKGGNPVLQGLPGLHPDNRHKIPCPTVKHHTLLRSQMQKLGSVMREGKIIRRLSPVVPELNSWKRPMPQKRLVNFAKAHWRTLMDKTMPPLPNDEWEDLRRLSAGETVPDGLGLSRVSKTVGSDRCDLEVALLEQSEFTKAMRREKIEKAGGMVKPHVIDARFMKRLWAQVFAICPRMEWDVDKQIWTVEWGIQALRKSKSGQNRRNAARFLRILEDN